VSLITVVSNRADTIAHALSSIAHQSYRHIQHIVIDGASVDGTLEILQQSGDTIDTLVSEADNGIYDALNKGLSRAQGDIVGLLHSDDFFHDSHVIEEVVEAFKDPSVDGVYGDVCYVTRKHADRVLRYWHAGEFSPDRLKKGWMPPHPALFLRRSVFERLGEYDVSFRIAADYDFILRSLHRGRIRLAYVPRVLVMMRMGGESNASLMRILRKSIEDYRALRKNQAGGLSTVFWKNLSKVPQFFIAKRRGLASRSKTPEAPERRGQSGKQFNPRGVTK